MTSESSTWEPAHGGSTLGMAGSEGGVIARDEDLSGAARLTLEEDASRGFYALTCGVEGWMVHTRYFSDAAEAHSAFEAMKPALAELLSRLPTERGPAGLRAGGALLSAFISRFP
ncbi:hypothetical protein P2318_16485 [Myxococcaceae bacterium GXIMD 01537]